MEAIPNHLEVSYHDPSHRYYVGSTTYLSSTQTLEQFKNKFDPIAESIRMSEDYGQTPEYWRNKWATKTDISLKRGNRIHDYQEDFLYGRGYDSVDGKVYPVQNRNLLPLHTPYHLLPDGVYPELKLWRHDYQIAGRSDKIIFRTVPAPINMWVPYTVHQAMVIAPQLAVIKGPWRFMDVEDYKTNQQIRTESFYRRDKVTGEKVYKMMKGPLSHLMDCELTHYTLQFSLYQFMGEYHGFLPGKRRLIFFRNDDMVYDGLLNDLPGETKPVVKELPYLRDEVIAMLEYLQQQRKVA